MNLFQAIFVPLCLCSAVYTILSKARRPMAFKTRFFWFVLFMAAGVTIAFPQITTKVAVYLGIGRGSDLVFYTGLMAGVFAIRHFYIRSRRLENMLTEVIRTNSIEKAKKGNSLNALKDSIES